MVTDAELGYSLYVQANPSPHPDLLSMTPDETEFRSVERSPVMDTQNKTEVPRRRRRGLAITAGAVVVVAAVAGIGLLIANSGDELVAAADANPEITFDGSTCVYEGPARIEQGQVNLTFVNTSDDEMYAAGWLLNEEVLAAELELQPLGSDRAFPASPPRGANSFIFNARAGDTATDTPSMAAGTHVIDCARITNVTEHVWRAASVEVVAP